MHLSCLQGDASMNSIAPRSCTDALHYGEVAMGIWKKDFFIFEGEIYRVFFFTGPPPKKLKYGKPRLGEVRCI